jgi:hypothetical protein
MVHCCVAAMLRRFHLREVLRPIRQFSVKAKGLPTNFLSNFATAYAKEMEGADRVLVWRANGPGRSLRGTESRQGWTFGPPERTQLENRTACQDYVGAREVS